MTNKILYSSPEAAERKQVTGWVSADGRFYGDNEDLARWAGCTHILCKECGQHEHEKSWTCCPACRDRHEIERYDAKPFKAWEGEPLFSYSHEKYFFDEQELIDFALDNDVLPGEMRLAICEPDILRMVDFDDIWVDRLPEDLYLSDMAPELAEAVAKVNDAIEKTKPVLAWNPGKYRTTVTAADLIAARTANQNGTAANAKPDQWRGHAINTDPDGTWRYTDNGVKASDMPDRACGHCGRHNTPEGHDACLGTLPGVMNACCGHGDSDLAYIQFEDGSVVNGSDAITKMALLGAGGPGKAA